MGFLRASSRAGVSGVSVGMVSPRCSYEVVERALSGSTTSAGRENDPRAFRIPAIKHRRMADAAYDLALRAAREHVERRVARLALQAGHAHLDQLVIVKRPRGLGDHGSARASLPDEDDGLEGVAETAKMAALL